MNQGGREQRAKQTVTKKYLNTVHDYQLTPVLNTFLQGRRSYLPIYPMIQAKVKVKSLSPTLCDPVSCSPPGSSILGILQARILEWVAIFFSRGTSRPRNRTQVSCIAGRCFNLWATKEGGPKVLLTLNRFPFTCFPDRQPLLTYLDFKNSYFKNALTLADRERGFRVISLAFILI